MIRSIFTLFIALSWGSACAQGYHTTYGEPGRQEHGVSLLYVADDALYLGGSVGDSALVMRMDVQGTVLWARKFKPPGQYPKRVLDIKLAPDGSIVGCGSGTGPAPALLHEGFYFRTSPDGTMYWVRNWSDPKVYSNLIIPRTADEYLLLSNHYDMSLPGTADIVTARIDATNGDPTWVSPRTNLYGPAPYIDDIMGMASLGQAHYGCGRVFTNGSPVSTCRVSLSKFDGGGQHQWTKYLLYSNSESVRMYGTAVVANNDSLTMYWHGNTTGASTNYTVGLIRADTLGNVAWAKSYNVLGSAAEQSHEIVNAPFGYVVSGRYTAPAGQRLFLMGLTHAGDPLWARHYGPDGQEQDMTDRWTRNMTALSDGFMATCHAVMNGNDRDIVLVRTDLDGQVECGGSGSLDVTVTVLPTSSFSHSSDQSAWTGMVGNPTINDVSTHVMNACDALTVDLGPDTTVCAALVLDATTPNAVYQWQDGSTSNTFLAQGPGTYWVQVTVDCCSRTDTISVAWGGGGTIDLGPDTLLCAGSTLTLALDPDLLDVQWQDGSSEHTFHVTEPGLYTVTASFYDCQLSGSVLVDMIDPPAVDLGPDTTVCAGDEVLLATGHSGLPHVWSDGSSDEDLLIDQAGTYWVQVGPAFCSGSDSIQLFVTPMPVVDLGADTLLCAGSGLTLAVDTSIMSVAWQDGSNGHSFLVESSGTYWVAASNLECHASDTIAVAFIDPPAVDLGPDTTVCAGDEVLLATGHSGLPHVWSDGSGDEYLLIDQAGTYWVQVGPAFCSGSDSIQLFVTPMPVVDLGADTLLCAGSGLTLAVDTSIMSVAWQDGSNGHSFLVESSGTYWVAASNLECHASDTIAVAFIDPPAVDLGPDTTVCAGDEVLLATGHSGLPHVWSDGSSDEDLLIDQAGTYWVQVGPAFCSGSDTVQLFVTPMPVVDLGADTVVCEVVAIHLSSGYPAANSLWQDGSYSAGHWATSAGTYSVVVNVEGCVDSASVDIGVVQWPVLNMPNDTLLCEPGPISITATSSTSDPVSWPGSSSGPDLWVVHPGTYVAAVSNACGTTQEAVTVSWAPPFEALTDVTVCAGMPARVDLSASAVSVTWAHGPTSLVVDLHAGSYQYTLMDRYGCLRNGSFQVIWDPASDGDIFVPNVFTPNNDGTNDLFRVSGAERSKFSMDIYNRWGELVYSDKDPERGWNGTYRGDPVPDGTYVYVVRFESPCTIGTQERTGHVTVVR